MSDWRLERLPTGISGLDVLLRGGVFRGGIYIVQGVPGAGKTILGNQLCFNHVKAGGRALYVTLLAETHSRMLGHIANFSFFDVAAVPDRVSYLSAYRVLEEEGLRGLLEMLRRDIQKSGATVLVLDGLVSINETAGSAREVKKFISELQTQAGLTDCTMFLLTSNAAGLQQVSAEHTMVDGLIEISIRRSGRRSERMMEVRKFRGSGSLPGMHSFQIDDDGVRIFPRIEAVLAAPSVPEQADGPAVSIGVPGLDVMLGGGPSRHSSTLIVGPAGSGKTIIGLQFLGAGGDEPGLFFTFNENLAAVRTKAETLGLPVAPLFATGQVTGIWQPLTEALLDEVCHRLLATVRARGVRRLFIDGVEGIARLADDKERVEPVMTALANELRGLGVTLVSTAELDFAGIIPGQPLAGLVLRDLSPVADNIAVLRHAATPAGVHRLVSILKSRDRRAEIGFRLFEIATGGVRVDTDFDRARRLLEALGGPGSGREAPPADEGRERGPS